MSWPNGEEPARGMRRPHPLLDRSDWGPATAPSADQMPRPHLGDRIRAGLDRLGIDHRDELDTALGRAVDAVDRRTDGE